MKKMLRTAAVLLAAGALIATSACGRGSDDSADGAKEVTLAISTLDNPFFVSLRDGATEEAKAQGIKLNVVDAQDDAATMTNQIQTAVTAKTKALIINPVDSDAATAAVQPAIDAKIPLVAVDRAVSGVTPDSYVASDNVAGGRQAAAELAKAIGEKGKVIVLQGTAGTSASRDRGQGFTEGIAAYSNIEVVATQTANFDREQGLNVATNLMQAHPDVVGIFAENDEMALGAVQALGDKAGQSVFVVGFDGTDEGLAAIKNGKMTATIAQQPKELGKVAVQLIAKLLNAQSVEATEPVPVTTVTKANVADFS